MTDQQPALPGYARNNPNGATPGAYAGRRLGRPHGGFPLSAVYVKPTPLAYGLSRVNLGEGAPAVPLMDKAPPQVPADMEGRLKIVIPLAARRLGGEARAQLMSLLEPKNLAILAGTLAAAAIANLTPAGWIADFAALAVTSVTLYFAGVSILEVGRHIVGFVRALTTARTPDDLETAADELAKLVMAVGVVVLMALLHKSTRRGGGPSEAEPAKSSAPEPKRSAPGNEPESQQPAQSTPAKPDPTKMTTGEKGVYGEAMSDSWMDKKGYTKMNGKLVQVGDKPIGQGIDGVWKNATPPPDYIVTETKYGTSRLATLADGTKQMSKKWVLDRLESAVGPDAAEDIEDSMAQGRVERWLLKVDASGNVSKYIVQ